MAKFDVDFSEARGEGAVPLRPVESVSHIDERPLIMQGVLGVANLFMEHNKTKKEEEKLQREQDIVSSFVRENTAINDAVASGSIKRHEAAIRQRAIFSKFASAYPTYVKQFGQLNKDLLEGTELGEIKEEEQASQDRDRKMLQDMVAAGYPIDASTPPDVREKYMVAFTQTRALDEKFKRESARAAEARAQGAEDRAVFTHTAKVKAADGLSQLAEAHLEPAMAMVSSLKDIPDKQVALTKLGTTFAYIDRAISEAAKHAPETAANWRIPFNDLKKMGEDVITGKVASEAYDNELKNLKTRIQIMALEKDPVAQALFAANVLFPSSIQAGIKMDFEMPRIFARFTSQGGVEGIPQIIGMDAAKESTLIQALQHGIDKTVSGGFKGKEEHVTKELNNGIKNLVTQAEQAVKLGAGFEKLAPAMDFFASAQFHQATKNGMVKPEDLVGIKNIQQRFYGESVAKVVTEVLDKPFNNTKRYGDLVEIGFTGGEVRVMSYDRSRSGELAPVLLEMEKAAKAVTTIIKSGSHLEGHTDYAKYWEENKSNLFPDYFTPEGKEKRTSSSFKKGKIVGATAPAAPAQSTPPANWWEAP